MPAWYQDGSVVCQRRDVRRYQDDSVVCLPEGACAWYQDGSVVCLPGGTCASVFFKDSKKS